MEPQGGKTMSRTRELLWQHFRNAGPHRDPGQTICRYCRYWEKSMSYPGEGECLLATGSMSLPDRAEPMMRAEAEECYSSRADMLAHALGGGASAVLLTQPDFTCPHADPRRDGKSPGTAEPTAR